MDEDSANRSGQLVPQPFFTIGVTTYNRHDLLLKTLMSILSQTFQDFEVIVGNDYTDEVLSGELLGISDPRIRFINYPQNLKEVGNMNALLSMAQGRYFTWLADDDLYESDFLRTAYELLVKNNFPPGFFSSYRVFWGTEVPRSGKITTRSEIVLSGREFLKGYLVGRFKTMPVYGLFDTSKLRTVVGGVEELCSAAVGLYGEYIFLVRCGLFEKIIYCNAPLVLYRAHADAWSPNNIELDKYLIAGPELIRRSGEVLRHPSLLGDLTKNLLGVCYIHLYAYASKLGKTNLAQKRFDTLTMYRSISNYFSETVRVRKSFTEAGGVNELNTTLTFTWFHCKCILLIMGIPFISLFRKLRGY
jgi:glycosyltransferase involved in cell wall biosynthesis